MDKKQVRKKVKQLLQYYKGGNPEELLEVVKEEIVISEKGEK